MKKTTLALAMMVGMALLVIGGCSKSADDASGTSGGTGTTGGTTGAGTTGATTGS